MGAWRSRAFGAAALFGACAGGCDPETPAAAPQPTGLPAWDPRAAQIFDDNIEPQAVGLSLETSSPRGDLLFRVRAQTAEVVGRMRVRTVTRDSVGENDTYHLSLEVARPPLATAKIPDTTFEVSIRSTSPAFPIARSLDAGLRGKTFVGFLKRFTSADGEPLVHFHLAPDTAEVAQAVKEAVILGEVSISAAPPAETGTAR